ncbi:acetyl-CoA hydrolase/transferase family protein [Rhodococcus sp. 14C212]|uniref:acetyl-CoA hydrolase/transferase family protein n=1 Tax=Rhodococcus sp. 14C212 TaxID=2711209 RepID=UPI0013EAE9F0|nr:acetyl-CoA hydrolase/transferase family protein [Rhodococcus sp. 14C212]
MTVASASLSAEPTALLHALAARTKELAGPITLVSGMFLDGYAALSPHLGHDIHLRTWFMPQTLLGDVGLGPHVDFLPLSWVQTYRYVLASTPDVCLIQVSPPDDNGFHSVGISASVNKALAQRARTVIAQVNPQMPYTFGDTLIHESEIDYLVEHDAPLVPFPHRRPDEIDDLIAGHIIDLIPDGATLQGGIGKVPEAVLRRLTSSGHSDLLITSQLTDAGRDLIEAGACRTDGPAAIVGEVVGSAELYRWVNREARVELQPAPITHGLKALSERRRFVSVNSTLEVDLYGQLNSEVVSKGQAGGIGGSVDFMMAAQLDDALSIIALPSTTARGRSRIIPVVDRGLVTAPRTLTQIVVTEQGIADLRGLTVGQRAEALLEVAHPDHRDELRSALGAS